jgi:hypothetical protein
VVTLILKVCIVFFYRGNDILLEEGRCESTNLHSRYILVVVSEFSTWVDKGAVLGLLEFITRVLPPADACPGEYVEGLFI